MPCRASAVPRRNTRAIERVASVSASVDAGLPRAGRAAGARLLDAHSRPGRCGECEADAIGCEPRDPGSGADGGSGAVVEAVRAVEAALAAEAAPQFVHHRRRHLLDARGRTRRRDLFRRRRSAGSASKSSRITASTTCASARSSTPRLATATPTEGSSPGTISRTPSRWRSACTQHDMGFLLNFHYSDTWADPGHQHTPSAWQSMSFDELRAPCATTTRRSRSRRCARLAFRRTWCRSATRSPPACSTLTAPARRTRTGPSSSALLKAGIAAVRDTDPSIGVMLQLDKCNDNGASRWWLDNAIEQGVEFDILAQSCYTAYQGTPPEWRSNFLDLVERYPNLEFVVGEYSHEKRAANQHHVRLARRTRPGQLHLGAHALDGKHLRCWRGQVLRNRTLLIDLYPRDGLDSRGSGKTAVERRPHTRSAIGGKLAQSRCQLKLAHRGPFIGGKLPQSASVLTSERGRSFSRCSQGEPMSNRFSESEASGADRHGRLHCERCLRGLAHRSWTVRRQRRLERRLGTERWQRRVRRRGRHHVGGRWQSRRRQRQQRQRRRNRDGWYRRRVARHWRARCRWGADGDSGTRRLQFQPDRLCRRIDRVRDQEHRGVGHSREVHVRRHRQPYGLCDRGSRQFAGDADFRCRPIPIRSEPPMCSSW